MEGDGDGDGHGNGDTIATIESHSLPPPSDTAVVVGSAAVEEEKEEEEEEEVEDDDSTMEEEAPSTAAPLEPPLVLTDELRDKIIRQETSKTFEVGIFRSEAVSSKNKALRVAMPSFRRFKQSMHFISIVQHIEQMVEYYFSDDNLPTDKYLMKYVKKDKGGFVPVAVVASFRKMRKLVKDNALVVDALGGSSQLVLSADGKKVKRIHPLPVLEAKDIQSHTVVVENLPEDCSAESIQRIFGEVGSIKSICIQDPHTTKDSAKAISGAMAISGKIHALVEYETVEAAEKAVTALNDEKNWRSGMRVELLLKRMSKYGFVKKGWRGNASEKHDFPASDMARYEQNVQSCDDHDETHGLKEADHLSSDKIGRKNRNRGRSRGHQQHIVRGHGHGSARPTYGGEGLNKPPPGPRMPDGTRGFTMGRGRLAPANEN